MARKHNILLLLAETTAIQAMGTMAVLVIPAIAPKVSEILGVPASQVGFQISLLYLAAMLSALISGTLVVKLGPCRTGQIAMLLTAVGCALVGIGTLFMLIFGSLVIGAAYGLINSASSDLLMRNVPSNRRSLFFSIKQTGVPLGGMMIGLIAPWTAIHFGWSIPLWIVAVTSTALAMASQPNRSIWDSHRDASVRLSGVSLEGFRSVARNRPVLWLALSSFCFAAVQLSLIAFLVVLLVQEVHLDLVTAGAIMAAVQVTGALGRIIWGIAADRVGNGLLVLIIVGLVMAGASAAVVGLSSEWPMSMVVGVFLVLGISAIGWNGVYLSEIARLSPPRTIGSTTGAAMFFTFMGVVTGPPLFSAVHGVVLSYAWSYCLLTTFALTGVFLVWAANSYARHSPV